jgi:hypothetical protein
MYLAGRRSPWAIGLFCRPLSSLAAKRGFRAHLRRRALTFTIDPSPSLKMISHGPVILHIVIYYLYDITYLNAAMIIPRRCSRRLTAEPVGPVSSAEAFQAFSEDDQSHGQESLRISTNDPVVSHQECFG